MDDTQRARLAELRAMEDANLTEENRAELANLTALEAEAAPVDPGDEANSPEVPASDPGAAVEPAPADEAPVA